MKSNFWDEFNQQMQRDIDQTVQASDFDITTATNSLPPSATELDPVAGFAKLQDLMDRFQDEFEQLMQRSDIQGSGTAFTIFVPLEAEREENEKDGDFSDLMDEEEVALIAKDQFRLHRRLAQLRDRCAFCEQMLEETRDLIENLEKHLSPRKGRYVAKLD